MGKPLFTYFFLPLHNQNSKIQELKNSKPQNSITQKLKNLKTKKLNNSKTQKLHIWDFSRHYLAEK